VPGRHSVSNALAAVAVGLELDLPFEWIASHLAQFRGADRRFQLKGEANGIMVIDDYGHHPAEIQATLEAARRGWNRRLVVVFQPHRYSRARRPARGVCALLRERRRAGGHRHLSGRRAAHSRHLGESLAEAIRRSGHQDVTLLRELAEVPPYLLAKTLPGDMVITMGAGSVWKAGDEFLKHLGTAR
jgi:UDP-N-acetylmuramate--alanine ligase